MIYPDSYTQYIIDYLVSNGPPIYEASEQKPKAWWRRFLQDPYVVDYVSPCGKRMPLTQKQYQVFVPFELYLSGSTDAYRDILNYRTRRS